MTEVKTHSDHPSSMAERIAKRLHNSGAGANPDLTTKTGDSPQRAFHNIHHSGSAKQHGTSHPGEGDINNNKRDVV